MSETITVRKVTGRPFPPGVSGNPGGMPRTLARKIRDETKNGEELVQRCLQVIRSKSKRTATRDKLLAIKMLMEYGWGKPPQAVAVAIGSAQNSEESALPPGTFRAAILALLTQPPDPIDVESEEK